MGATLRYAKVVDRDRVQEHGGVTPSTDNVVQLAGDAPATARDFIVARAWDGIEAGVEERWRLEDAHGHVVYRGAPRTVLAGHGDIADELRGVRFEHTDDDYQLVFELDELEVARAAFAVVASTGVPPSTDADVAIADDVPPDSGGAGDAAVTGDGDERAVTTQPVEVALSDVEQQVLDAVAAVEADRGPGHVTDIAGRAGVDVDDARDALSRLMGDADLVQQLAADADDGPDLGPRYRVKARP